MTRNSKIETRAQSIVNMTVTVRPAHLNLRSGLSLVEI
jgi:hypothetical protein